MITIGKPEITHDSKYAKISVRFYIQEERQELWYKMPVKFKEFLVTENLDAFVVSLLFLGLKTGNDIKLEGAISARLFYTLNHYLIPALRLANPEFKAISIFPESLNEKNINTENVAATGLSCGVDSFATYYDNINEKGSYKIKYFTFFNVGSHGDFGGIKARNVFNQRLDEVKKFAKKVNLDLIDVDSNLSEILRIDFQSSHSFRSISCALLLQKLFKNYYYASAYRLDHFKINKNDTSDSDIFNTVMLSTESTNFYSSVSQYSRIERTLLITDHGNTFQFLNVCTQPVHGSNFINCSTCYKCLRTQLTLEAAGKLKFYYQVFDIDKYNDTKYEYLGELITKRTKSPLDAELLAFLRFKKFKMPEAVKFYSLKYIIITSEKILKKNIKSLLKNYNN